MKKAAILLVLSILSPLLSRAVVIAGGDGTGNTSAPTGEEQGWNYVGRLSNVPSSVTYLGNRWFITANHIKVLDNPTSVLLNGQTYTIDPEKWTRITNSTGSGADLMMFQVRENVGLANLAISSATPSSGTFVTMIGNGLDREPDLFYDSDVDEYFYALKTGTANTSKRWGINTVNGAYYNNNGFVDAGYGATQAFYTDFSPFVNEAQAATYDSGGGVFVGEGDALELAGIMVAAKNYNEATLAVLTGGGSLITGSETYIADMSAYEEQITHVIPEPSTGILMAGIATLFGVAHRIRFMFE